VSLHYLHRLYELLTVVSALPGQGLQLKDYSGSSRWPERGVYFFTEPGELRQDGVTSRIVRVGTHAVSANAKSRLWERLRAHRGGRDGGGNHRGSIFRLHVGAALLQRTGSAGDPATWSIGQSASREIRDEEREHELRVSAFIGRMSVLWVEVPDEPGPASARVRVERNAIALLSNRLRPFDPPSQNWLGRHSARTEIRQSGLWNLNYVSDVCQPQFVDEMEEYVTAMI
jgi:hypothetical protein